MTQLGMLKWPTVVTQLAENVWQRPWQVALMVPRQGLRKYWLICLGAAEAVLDLLSCSGSPAQ